MSFSRTINFFSFDQIKQTILLIKILHCNSIRKLLKMYCSKVFFHKIQTVFLLVITISYVPRTVSVVSFNGTKAWQFKVKVKPLSPFSPIQNKWCVKNKGSILDLAFLDAGGLWHKFHIRTSIFYKGISRIQSLQSL